MRQHSRARLRCSTRNVKSLPIYEWRRRHHQPQITFDLHPRCQAQPLPGSNPLYFEPRRENSHSPVDAPFEFHFPSTDPHYFPSSKSFWSSPNVICVEPTGLLVGRVIRFHDVLMVRATLVAKLMLTFGTCFILSRLSHESFLAVEVSGQGERKSGKRKQEESRASSRLR